MNTVPKFLQALFQKMAWAVPAAPVLRQVRVESTTPRKLVLVSAPYEPGRGTDGFALKTKLHEPRDLDMRSFLLADGPAKPLIRDVFGSRKARRAARHGDSGQHPKPLVVRKHAQHVHPHDADGRAFTLVGKGFTRRVWLGGISAQRGY